MRTLLAFALLLAACSEDTTDPSPSDAGSGGPTDQRDGSRFPDLFGEGGIFSGGFGRQQCPDTQPTSGGSCSEGRGDCTYGSVVCDCDDDAWACWDPADCPASAPEERAACNPVGMQCEYEGTGRDELDCECAAEGWDCGRQVCPAAEPAPGSACDEGDGQCAFGARVCECDDDAWACWDPAECPGEPPPEGAQCGTQGMRCPYGRGQCSCGEDGWDCSRGVQRDAGASDGGDVAAVTGMDAG